MTPFPPQQAGTLPKANDVIYRPGWSYCYRILSAPFCRIHYLKSQDSLTAAPSDSADCITYRVQPLGGRRVDQLVLRLSS